MGAVRDEIEAIFVRHGADLIPLDSLEPGADPTGSAQERAVAECLRRLADEIDLLRE